MNSRILRSHVSAALLASVATASALTVPVAEDASTTTGNSITPATGKAGSLPVNAKQTAFIRFDLSDPVVIPPAVQPSSITSATLRIYIARANPAGILTVHPVMQAWTEAPPKATPPPALGPVFSTGTIPLAEVVSKRFVSVDVTASIKTALGIGGNDFGFAISTTAAKVLLGSKEGPGTGYAAELDIEADLPETGNETIDGSLLVSTSFTVEARPNATGGLNNFIGINAGAADTTGLGNTFVGHNCGKATIDGSSNSFYGLNSGSSNTSGQLNCFFGQGSGAFSATGSNNNCFGQAAGFNLNAGNSNNFFGWKAGFASFNGSNNTFLGDQAGIANTASDNTFVGAASGFSNTGGTRNVFVGFSSGKLNSTASDNTSVGYGAGLKNSLGFQNCFFGVNAGNQTTSSFNAFFGAGAGQQNSSGLGNVFFGNIAGLSNTTGSNNLFLGGNTGGSNTTESRNSFIGDSANGAVGVTNSTALGANALVTASNCLVLGSVNGQNGAGSDTNVGIGVTAPNSYLQVNGSLSLPVRATASSLASFGAADYVLVTTVTNAAVVLPSAAGITGRMYVLKNRAPGSVTLNVAVGSSQTIDGSPAAITLASNAAVHVQSDGANWIKIN